MYKVNKEGKKEIVRQLKKLVGSRVNEGFLRVIDHKRSFNWGKWAAEIVERMEFWGHNEAEVPGLKTKTGDREFIKLDPAAHFSDFTK